MSPKKVRPHLSEDIKNRIAGLRQSNLSYKQIFDILKKENVKTSLSAVKRIGQRFEIEGSVRRKSGSGRPRASTVKDDHRLKMTVLKDRKKTYVDHSKEFKTAAGNSLSRMTISRRLNEVGFNSKKCAKKPLFPAIKVLKLAWPIFFVHECTLIRSVITFYSDAMSLTFLPIFRCGDQLLFYVFPFVFEIRMAISFIYFYLLMFNIDQNHNQAHI